MYLHLFVCWANLTFSDENCSSRSNRSRQGGGNSLNCGGNTWKDWGKNISNTKLLICTLIVKRNHMFYTMSMSLFYLIPVFREIKETMILYGILCRYSVHNTWQKRGRCFFSWSFLSSLMVVDHSHGFKFKLIFT